MDRSRLLALVVQLGGEFRRRDMPEHLRKLRLYYLALTHQLDARESVEIHWTSDMVVEWFRTLRLPPYQDDYPVQSTTACRTCPATKGAVFTVSTFPGGAKLECRMCGQRWLYLHDR
jgi:hypothetical protein